MYTYVKYNIPSFYIEFYEELNPEIYTNIGETYEDFLNNKYVLLTSEQEWFHKENPNATVKEVLDMKLAPANLEELKNVKIDEIDKYDKSSEVNSFILNGVPVWVDRETRVSLMNTTQIKKSMGEEETTIWFDNYSFTMSCDMVVQMLSALEMYAYGCFNATAMHKAEVLELDDEDSIKNYDYKSGYPEKLSFDTLM